MLTRRRGDKYRIIKTALLSYKSKKCVDCAVENLPDCCYDFDHRNPYEKFWTVGYLIAAGASLEDLKREVDKCDVRCANCHRIRTCFEMQEQLSQKNSLVQQTNYKSLRKLENDAMSYRLGGNFR